MNENKITLQSHNDRLSDLLEQVNTLPDKYEPVFETWVFTLEDGSTVEKEVEVSTE